MTATKQRTVVSYIATQFLPSSSPRSSIFRKEPSSTKKSRRDRDTPRETSSHKSANQEPLQTRRLEDILSIAESFCSKTKPVKSVFNAIGTPKKKEWAQHSADVAQSAGGTRTTRGEYPNDDCCGSQFFRPHVASDRRTKQTSIHGSSPSQLHWATVRDQNRRSEVLSVE